MKEKRKKSQFDKFKYLGVRLSPGEYAKVLTKAAEKGKTQSDIIRELINQN